MHKKLFGNRKLRFLIAGIVIIAGGLGYYYRVNVMGAEADPTYQETAVSRGDITVGMEADGTADLSVTNLSFNVGGKLTEVLVEPGQAVKAGELIARLDDTDYVNKLTKAEQDYNLTLISCQSKLDDLKYQLDTLETEYNAMNQIPECYTEKELNDEKKAYEKAKAAYEAQLASNELTIASGQTSIKTAQDDINNTVLVSPIDSTVLAVNYSAGERVPEDTTCIVLQNDAQVEVIASVSEVDIGTVAVGQQVEAVFDAFDGESFTGKVTYVDSLPVSNNSGLVSYAVTIVMDGGKDKIKTGMTCTANFIQKQVKDVLIIPNKAISMVNKKQVVRVKKTDGSIENREIKTGFSDGTNVEVTEGLNEGEIVLVVNAAKTTSTDETTTQTRTNMNGNASMGGPPMGMGM